MNNDRYRVTKARSPARGVRHSTSSSSSSGSSNVRPSPLSRTTSTSSVKQMSADLPLVNDAFWEKQGLWLPFGKSVQGYFPRYYADNFDRKDGKKLSVWEPKNGKPVAVPDGGWTWDSMTRYNGVFYNPISHSVRYIPWQPIDDLWNKRDPFAKLQQGFVAYHLRLPDTQLLEVYVKKSDGMVVLDVYNEPNRELPAWKLDRVWYHHGDNSASLGTPPCKWSLGPIRQYNDLNKRATPI